MSIPARIGFAIVKWKAGMACSVRSPLAREKTGKRWELERWESDTPTGICAASATSLLRGTTLARCSESEIDLVGYACVTIGFCGSTQRATVKGKTGLPELSITRDKRGVFVRTANQFLREWHIVKCLVRFDVLAIDHVAGNPPVVRLHKDALSPEIRRPYLSRI
jgi:Holliday junction resolvase-like predicted endonuclease